MAAFELYKIAAIHTVYLALVGGATWAWFRWVGVDVTPMMTLICALPVLLSLALTFTSTADEQQYIIRLAACSMFTPALLLFWAISTDAPALPRWSWAYGVSAGLLHMAIFVGSVFWLGTSTTRVAANTGVAPVDIEILHARLLSLNEIGGPLVVSSSSANELTALYRFRSPNRSYRVLLNLDAATHQVRVRERTSADGARPETEAERSMRGPGDPYFDPTRPEARRVSETTAQVTPIKRQQLKATPASLHDRVVEVPSEFAASLDPDGMLTLLCAVATRSGWTWQPGFFGAE